MRRAIRAYGRYVAAIIAFFAIAVAVASYILVHQRLRLPFQARYTLNAEFQSATAVTAGLGEPVNVAGVRVGDITGVTLRNGIAVVKLSIDPGKLPHVFANAQAVLHPNTPLQDMLIDIVPGGAPAPAMHPGATIGLARTQVPVAVDSFTTALDADTRDFLAALIQSAGVGLHGRGLDLRGLLRSLGPTAHQISQLSTALLSRRQALARVIHNFGILSQAAASRNVQLEQVILASDQTLGALAGQDAQLGDAIARLPGTLGAAKQTLTDTVGFAHEIPTALAALERPLRALPAGLHAIDPLLRATDPLLRNRVAPFVTASNQAFIDLLPAVTNLSAGAPDLSSAFLVLDYVAAELGYVPPDGRGYLFWLGWFAHNANSMLSSQDAHGPTWHGFAMAPCSVITAASGITAVDLRVAGLTSDLCK